MMLEWTTILSPVVNAFSEESVISSIGIVQAITGVDRAALVDAVATNQHTDWSFAVVAYETTDPISRVRAWNSFIVECQKVVARFDASSSCRGSLGNRQDGCMRPAHRKRFMGVRSKLARQARHRACFKADLR
jgi:hypothetical protein